MSANADDNREFQPPEIRQNDQPAQTPPPDQAQPRSMPADQFRQAQESRRAGEDDDEETDLWQGSFSSRAMIGKWVLAGAVTIILPIIIFAMGIGNALTWWGWAIVSIGLWGYFVLQLAYRKLTVKYFLTSQRFIHQSGLLKRVTDRIEVIDIDDVSFEQRIVERIVGVGSIKITSSDRSHPELWMRGIENVGEVAGTIDDIRRKERRRRGLHIEAI
jgi:uncharacterized membrane protein YdbT with pleckstrin-like domain